MVSCLIALHDGRIVVVAEDSVSGILNIGVTWVYRSLQA